MKSNKDLPEKGIERFTVTLHREGFATFSEPETTHNLEVLSDPVEVYHQWYWRTLNILTFGFFFNRGWIYDVKIKSKDND